MKRENAKNQSKVAILSAALNHASSDGWYQLLPAGKFKARDGRPFDTKDGYWHLDENIAKAFIARTIKESNGKKVLIDYDHQTLHKEETGQKAPAAGRILDPAHDIEWRENGIYIRPRWTPIAQSEINNEQYNELSAVFPYDEDGHPLYLRMAAITNDPGLLDINSLVALAAELFNDNQPTQENTNMNELLKTLLIALGVLSADEKAEELTEERLKEISTKAVENVTALKAASAAAAEVKKTVETDPAGVPATVEQAIDDAGTEIATAEEIIAEAKLHSIDLSKAVPLSVYQKAVNKIAVLSANNTGMTVEQLIANGRKAGKVIKANEGYLIALGQTKGVAALSAALDACTPIAALAAKQTDSIPTPKSDAKGVAVLSAEQKEAARLLGKSEADYLNIIKGDFK